MKNYILSALAVIVLCPLAGKAQVVIASNNFDAPLNLISETITVDNPFMSFGDIFGSTNANSGAPDNAPFSVIDDSNPACPSFFPNDNQGVVPCSYPSRFFAMSDTENPDNMGDVSAEWVFDISGSVNLTNIKIDMSAMGDFEVANDNFIWSYSIDGGPSAVIFNMMPDEAISATYTMFDGDMFTLNDPMKVNGILLLNNFTTFTAPVSGSGSQLTLRLEGMGDGGAEALAWDNIEILGISSGAPVPTMSQWGMFLFALIMITFGVVFVFNSQQRLALNGANGVSGSFNTQQLPFDKTAFQSALTTAMALAVPGFALIYFGWGEIVAADFIGMAMAVPIVAYLIHVVKLFGKNE